MNDREPTPAEGFAGCVVAIFFLAFVVAAWLALARVAGVIVIDFEQWLKTWRY